MYFWPLGQYHQEHRNLAYALHYDSLKALLEGVSPSAIDGQAHAKQGNLCHGLIPMVSDPRCRFSRPERLGRSAGQGYERVQLGHSATISWDEDAVNGV